MIGRTGVVSLPLAGRVSSGKRSAPDDGRGSRAWSAARGTPPGLRFAQATLPTRGRDIARFSAAGLLLLLAACQTGAPQGYVLLHANQDPVSAARQISDKVGECWFGEGNSRFADYVYAPELSSSERPRVLIVSKSDPTGLPQLVIEIVRAKRGSDVRLFGPVMEGSEAERIRGEVAFWAGGGRTCR
ncbi:MAG: hypothetical protein ACRED5_02545 [Propylenella sp.]